MQSEYQDNIYELLLHFKDDMGADSASVSYFENYKSKPILAVIFTKMNLVIRFDLQTIITCMDQWGYQKTRENVDEQIYKILKNMGFI